MRYIGLSLLFICIFSCKKIVKPIIHAKTIEEGLYHSIFKTYEKIYGNVKTICDSGYSIKEISGKKYGRLDWVVLFKFDIKGNEVEVDVFDDDSVLRWKSINIYDSDNELKKEYYYKPGNELMSTYVFDYNKKANVTGYTEYTSDDGKVPESRCIEKVNSVGNIIDFRFFDRKNNLVFQGYGFAYDNKGNVIDIHLNNLLEKFENKTKYDDSDNVIEDISKKIDQNTIDTFRYQYKNKDSCGNWRKKAKYQNDTLIEVTDRVIGYY